MKYKHCPFLDLLYPRKCYYCRRILTKDEDALCGDCLKLLPQKAEERTGDFFRLCVAPLPYAGGWRDAILRFKFNGMSFYADWFGKLLARTVSEELEGTYDLITWVPVSRKRRRSRGYDQTQLLAKTAAKELGAELVPTLKKIRHNRPQSGIRAASERKINVLNAYRAEKPEQIEGKRILLIDDIITTGATLSECAKTLENAGAKRIVCAALAATEKK